MISPERNRFSALVVKITISVAGVCWLLVAVDWKIVSRQLTDVAPLPLFLSLLLYSCWLIPCPLRWKTTAAYCGYPISMKDATQGYLIGAFFSAFLPTAKGGDLVRGLVLAREKNIPAGGLLATIIFERFVGLSVSLLLVLGASLFLVGDFPLLRPVSYSSAFLGVFLIAAVAVYFNKRFRSHLQRLLKHISFNRLREGLEGIVSVLDVCRRPSLLAVTAWYSFVNQAILIGSGLLMAEAIPDFSAPWSTFALVIPLNFIAVLLPSIGGYGVREAGFVIFFGWFGVNPEAAGVFSLLQLLFMWLFSLAGGICFVARRSVVK